MIGIASLVSNLYVLVWLVAAITATYAKLPLARTISSEMRPLYLPMAAIAHATSAWLFGDPLNGWRLFGTACNIANYWLFRDKDDDRWKRRRKKIAEKISRQGSRLVVVPASAS